jgi:hypothetical protein
VILCRCKLPPKQDFAAFRNTHCFAQELGRVDVLHRGSIHRETSNALGAVAPMNARVNANPLRRLTFASEI